MMVIHFLFLLLTGIVLGNLIPPVRESYKIISPLILTTAILVAFFSTFFYSVSRRTSRRRSAKRHV